MKRAVWLYANSYGLVFTFAIFSALFFVVVTVGIWV